MEHFTRFGHKRSKTLTFLAGEADSPACPRGPKVLFSVFLPRDPRDGRQQIDTARNALGGLRKLISLPP